MNWFRYIFVLSTLMILIQKSFKVNKILIKRTKLSLLDVIFFKKRSTTFRLKCAIEVRNFIKTATTSITARQKAVLNGIRATKTFFILTKKFTNYISMEEKSALNQTGGDIQGKNAFRTPRPSKTIFSAEVRVCLSLQKNCVLQQAEAKQKLHFLLHQA